MQTYLEQEAIDKRDVLEKKNDYIETDNEYSVNHKDALSDGDPQGKGTGSGGHSHFLPDHTLGKTTINYSNFNTTQGGGSYDVDARQKQQVREMYSKKNPYDANSIDMSANIGQYNVSVVQSKR